jgi:hypothetical protein
MRVKRNTGLVLILALMIILLSSMPVLAAQELKADTGNTAFIIICSAPILTQAFADKQGYYQSGYPGTDMNYRTSSKIQGSQLAQPTSSPYPVGYRIINQSGPQENEEYKGREPHPFCKSASD